MTNKIKLTDEQFLQFIKGTEFCFTDAKGKNPICIIPPTHEAFDKDYNRAFQEGVAVGKQLNIVQNTHEFNPTRF